MKSRRPSDTNPRSPHRFQPIDDPGLAAFAASGGNDALSFGQITMVGTADNYIRKSVCGLDGCGKPRYDPIHDVGTD